MYSCSEADVHFDRAIDVLSSTLKLRMAGIRGAGRRQLIAQTAKALQTEKPDRGASVRSAVELSRNPATRATAIGLAASARISGLLRDDGERGDLTRDAADHGNQGGIHR